MDFYSFYTKNLGALSEAAFGLFWTGDYASCHSLLDQNIKVLGASGVGLFDLLLWHCTGLRTGAAAWDESIKIPRPPSPDELKNLFEYESSREKSLLNELESSLGILHQPLVLNKAILVSAIGLRNDCRVAIETGTYMGTSSYVFSGVFDIVETIEADASLHRSAATWLAHAAKNVRCHLGNSASVIADVVKDTAMKKIFFLDAHFSGGPTSQQYGLCPLLEELKIIMECARDSVVVVDDARLFGSGGYPTFAEIFNILPRGKKCTIEHDQLVIV